MSSNYDWAGLVQTRAGITPTTNTNQNFVRWMAAENPVSDWYHLNNPLNCGLNDGSADGEGSYPDLDYAATETASVLSQSNMRPIWNALNSNADLATFSAGCADSAWSTGGYHGNPGYIASIPLPAVVQGPAFPAPTPPAPTPTPLPPLPLPILEDTMSTVVLPSGEIAVTAVGAASRANHLLVFTLNPTNPNQPNYNVIDVTDGIGTATPYTVESA